MDKTQINVERMRTCDAEWEEQKHPRAENGQFTSGSGSAGSSAKPNAKPAAKSPLKKAAAAKKSNVITGYKGKTYTQGITGAAANTPAGEVHNLIVGHIESSNPTKEEIAEAAWYVADENLNDEVHRCIEMTRKFERDGNSYAAKAWKESLAAAKKKVELCRKIAQSMSAKDSASPLQQAAAALRSE